MDSQKITLKTYDNFAERYDRETPSTVDGDFKQLLNEFLSLLVPGATVLEIGTGSGRDAKYIESRGYKVIRTDASTGMADYLRSKGYEVFLFNPIKERFSGKYDALLAGAVLLHFTEEELHQALDNLVAGLPTGGYFYFWVKAGEGEEFSDHKMGGPRYFKYWDEENLEAILKKHSMEIIKTSRLMNGKWLHALARKSK